MFRYVWFWLVVSAVIVKFWCVDDVWLDVLEFDYWFRMVRFVGCCWLVVVICLRS